MSEGEFRAILLPVKDRMFRLAERLLGDRADAQDAVQDVCERMWRRREELVRCDAPEAFVMTVARNLCLDRLRSRKAKRRHFTELVPSLRAGGSPAVSVEERDLKTAVVAAIATLGERQRTVIHLRDVEGYEIAEIARIANMDEAAVRVNLSRARKTIRDRIQAMMNYGI